VTVHHLTARAAMLAARFDYFERRIAALHAARENRDARQRYVDAMTEESRAKERYLAAIDACERAVYGIDAPSLLRPSDRFIDMGGLPW